MIELSASTRPRVIAVHSIGDNNIAELAVLINGISRPKTR
jgi:hypothetical protein